jgi:hypothetical protein
MSYYKHIKTVQAFQLGNIIPIAPRILVRQASCLSAGGSSQDSNPISITPVGAKEAAAAHIDKILAM